MLSDIIIVINTMIDNFWTPISNMKITYLICNKYEIIIMVNIYTMKIL